MKILVINCGSSSAKFELIDMTNEQSLAKGNCERIGIANPIFSYKNLFFVFYHYFNIDKLKKSYICKLKINK